VVRPTFDQPVSLPDGDFTSDVTTPPYTQRAGYSGFAAVSCHIFSGVTPPAGRSLRSRSSAPAFCGALGQFVDAAGRGVVDDRDRDVDSTPCVC
jgi:hypothetical protein